MLNTFLYGPQTSGKSTRLLQLIKRDHGQDIILSGENPNRIDNGKNYVNTTCSIPPKLKLTFITKLKRQMSYPVKHIIVDGAQYLSIQTIKHLIKSAQFNDQNAKIIFAGCLYYFGVIKNSPIIKSSQFLLNHCQETIPVKRQCAFCHRTAQRLWGKIKKQPGQHQIQVIDPKLVCNKHYRILSKKFT